MRRFLSTKDLYVGQLVVTGDAVGAVVRTIAEIDLGNCSVVLQWMEGNRFCSRSYDSYMLKKPTLEQIECSISTYGQLLSSKQIFSGVKEDV